jgi:hypothetical protein
MEPVDFTLTQKKRSRDHAGWAAYLFRDIRERNAGAVGCAVVNATDEDKSQEDVSCGIQLLGNESDVISWQDHSQLDRFLHGKRESPPRPLSVQRLP